MDSREDIKKDLNNFFENLLNEPTEDKTEAIGKITKHTQVDHPQSELLPS